MICTFPKTLQNVNLTWTYKNSTGEHALWFCSYCTKHNRVLNRDPNYIKDGYRDKVSYGRFVSRGMHMIELSHVTERDEGEYSCKVETQHYIATFSKMLNVTGKILFFLDLSMGLTLSNNILISTAVPRCTFSLFTFTINLPS